MRFSSYPLLMVVLALAAGCSRSVPVRNTNFRSVRLHLEGGECIVSGLESKALPTKLAQVQITRNGKGTYRVKGRYAEISEEPLQDAEILAVMPASKDPCQYRVEGNLGRTNMQGRFDFKFLPNPRQEVYLYKPGYTPQMLKLAIKVKKRR